MSQQNTVTFYYNPMSRGRIVHWMLEECGAPYEIKSLKWETQDHKSPEYLKINPMGKIPAIVHRGVAITEVSAICAYLADAFPEANLAPKLSDPLRGAYYRWLFFAASNIESAMVDKQFPRSGEGPKASHLGYGSYEDVINALELAVKDGFLLGNQFTAADLYMSSQLGWYLFMKVLDPRPAFVSYVKLCEDRPAFRRYMEQAGPIG